MSDLDNVVKTPVMFRVCSVEVCKVSAHAPRTEADDSSLKATIRYMELKIRALEQGKSGSVSDQCSDPSVVEGASDRLRSAFRPRPLPDSQFQWRRKVDSRRKARESPHRSGVPSADPEERSQAASDRIKEILRQCFSSSSSPSPKRGLNSPDASRPLKRAWKAPCSPLASSPDVFPEEPSPDVKRPRRSRDCSSTRTPLSASSNEEPAKSPTSVLAGLQVQISALADSLASRSRRRKDVSLPVKRSRRPSSDTRSPRCKLSSLKAADSSDRGVSREWLPSPGCLSSSSRRQVSGRRSFAGDESSPDRLPSSGKRSSPVKLSSSSVRPSLDRRSLQSRHRSSTPSRRSSPYKHQEPRRRLSPGRRSSPGSRSPFDRHQEPRRRLSPVRRPSPSRRQEPRRRLSPGRRSSPNSRSPLNRHQEPRRHRSPGRRSSLGRRSSPDSRSPLVRHQEPHKRSTPSRRSDPNNRSPRDRCPDSRRGSPPRKRPASGFDSPRSRSQDSPSFKISSNSKRESSLRQFRPDRHSSVSSCRSPVERTSPVRRHASVGHPSPDKTASYSKDPRSPVQEDQDGSDDEANKTAAVSSYKKLTELLLQEFGDSLSPTAPPSPHSLFSKSKATKGSSCVRMKPTLSMKKALRSFGSWLLSKEEAGRMMFAFPPSKLSGRTGFWYETGEPLGLGLPSSADADFSALVDATRRSALNSAKTM
ncbi:serine/arginine repetitive matrix protein 1-like [Macrobrachium nipponense]|uniref:serine/arginine repetitive matrix protein 1-like n=1 Tax=Macrobrachium nipponense TaxID=159736 RepID=UPI0030C8231B